MASRLGKLMRRAWLQGVPRLLPACAGRPDWRGSRRVDRCAHHEPHQLFSRAGPFRFSCRAGFCGMEGVRSHCGSGAPPVRQAKSPTRSRLRRGSTWDRKSPILPRILATDISTRVLETARKGIYKAERFQGDLAPWLKKHLLRGEGRWQGWYRMRPEILSMVEFRRVNLIEPLARMWVVSR